MTLRQFVVEYPMRTDVMTEYEWNEEFIKFKIALRRFRESNIPTIN